MSPIKRAFAEDSTAASVMPKRLRGGGVIDDDADDMPSSFEPDPDDDDLLMEENEHIPEEALLEAARVVQDTDKTRWMRPPVSPERLTNQTDLNLQWLDMDVVTGKPLPRNPNAKKAIQGRTDGAVPVLRTFGVEENGHSVAVFIHGFTSYCYFALPLGYELIDESHLGKIREELTSRLKNAARGQAADDAAVMGVVYIQDCKSIMGYNAPHCKFFKILVSLPGLIPPLKRIMEEGISLDGVEPTSDQACTGMLPCYTPFECNVPFVLRYMVDRDIGGAGWLTLPAETYSIRSASRKETHCQVCSADCGYLAQPGVRPCVLNDPLTDAFSHVQQIEVDIVYDEIIARKSEGEWNKMAPLRVLSFDIECQGRKGHFPEAEKDPVIQIANCVSVYGQKEPIIRNVFTLGGCLPIVGAQVITSDKEEDMLVKWRAFLEAVDPDLISGYNVQNFDIPYLLNRAEALAKDSSRHKTVLQSFAQWGRIRNTKAKMKDTMFSSSAYGRRSNVETTIEGRVIFDMFPYMQRNHKLSSYSLNAVCAEFLNNQQKEDVHHSIISDLQNGCDEDRHRLAVYCLKDALLPQRLMDKLSVLVNYIEMARVTGVPVSFLISRGQQIKVFSMILRKCRHEKLLVPTLRKSGGPGDEVGYEGATVLEPIKGYYETPVATLDFASLYPSIMQAYNLCYSTLVAPQDIGKTDPATYKKSDNGHIFVDSSVKKGILPTILDELLSARKRAKKDMKNAPNEFERAVQNGRQLALKVSANSVYGFTGATVGQLPCVPIASSVTSYGRMLLETTKSFVEETYTKANGFDHDAVVIYGDTDSVFVKFGTETIEKTFPLAIEAAKQASAIFPDPILLEFEKVYYPFLLM
jgi:DNA polymerase delta subunit 1